MLRLPRPAVSSAAMHEHRQIVLATQNARFHHVALGLRCLAANLAELASQAALLEFSLKDDTACIAGQILQYNPRIVGLSVYVWNVSALTQLALLLKEQAPELRLVVGGPEVSYEQSSLELCSRADWIVSGEGELSFAELCRRVLDGSPPPRGIFRTTVPDPAKLALPYSLYSDNDLALRTTYIETARGCPFQCEFCLSSLDRRVRFFPLEPLLREIDTLIERGATHLKFVDRTFNTDSQRASVILDFLLRRWRPGMFYHFEIVAEHLSEKLKLLLQRFSPGALQLEAGVQTFNAEVAERIGRSTDFDKLERNLAWLRAATSAHVHADLIAGLPGEDLESFASGFDRLFSFSPHEIQIGILKRLKGTAISRHGQTFRMAFSPDPPYEVLSTKDLSGEEVCGVKRTARFFDLIWNSGRFPFLCPFLAACSDSPFQTFWILAHRLYERFSRTHSIDRADLREGVVDFLSEHLPAEKPAIHAAAEDERQMERRSRRRVNGHCRQQRHASDFRPACRGSIQHRTGGSST